MMQLKTNVAQDRKRTRADAYRERIQIRLAVDGAGPKIAEVLKENGIEVPGALWDSVWPHWLIACDRDAPEGQEVIGCIQVMPGKPVGWLEFAFTRKSAPYKLRIIAFRKLLEQGVGTLKMAGCSYVAGTVEPGNKGFLDILKKHNALHVGDVVLMAKRLK